MSWDETLAIVGIAGFAVQRGLEVIDFAIVPAASGIKKLFDRLAASNPEKFDWGVTQVDTKKWLTSIIGFAVGLVITNVSNIEILATLDSDWKTLDPLIGALAISGGSEGYNSVLKFAGHAKEARKIAARPLPEVKVTPADATINKGKTVQIMANVAGTDVKTVSWELLELAEGVRIEPKAGDANTGLFTAPNVGIFHVAAVSTDNRSANAVATITVV